MTVDDIISDILRREGWPKYTNRASDRGGPTKGGITLKTLEAWKGRKCSVEELQNLSEIEARKIYNHFYAKQYEGINDEALKVFLIDYSVNSGHDDATKALQTGLKAIGAYSGAIDGIWGSGTTAGIKVLNTLNLVNTAKVYKAAWKQRQDFYLRLALSDGLVVKFLRENPESQLHNLHGWLNRNTEFL